MRETNMGTEKRQYPRVDTQIPVRYRKQGDSAETAASGSLAGDVSAGGLKFRAKEFICAASNLILELDLPTLTRPIIATAKVVWIKNANAGEDYQVGNQFMEITKKDQEVIMQFVHGLR